MSDSPAPQEPTRVGVIRPEQPAATSVGYEHTTSTSAAAAFNCNGASHVFVDSSARCVCGATARTTPGAPFTRALNVKAPTPPADFPALGLNTPGVVHVHDPDGRPLCGAFAVWVSSATAWQVCSECATIATARRIEAASTVPPIDAVPLEWRQRVTAMQQASEALGPDYGQEHIDRIRADGYDAVPEFLEAIMPMLHDPFWSPPAQPEIESLLDEYDSAGDGVHRAHSGEDKFACETERRAARAKLLSLFAAIQESRDFYAGEVRDLRRKYESPPPKMRYRACTVCGGLIQLSNDVFSGMMYHPDGSSAMCSCAGPITANRERDS